MENKLKDDILNALIDMNIGEIKKSDNSQKSADKQSDNASANNHAPKHENSKGEIPQSNNDSTKLSSKDVALEDYNKNITNNKNVLGDIGGKAQSFDNKRLGVPQKPNAEPEIKKEKRHRKITEPKDKHYKNSYIYGFIFIAFAILFDIAGVAYLNMGFMPTNFGIELSIILIISGIIFIVPTKVLRIILSMLAIFGMAILNIINAGSMNTVGSLYVIGDCIYFDQGAIILNGLLFLLFIIVLTLGSIFMPKYRLQKNRTAIVCLIILILVPSIMGAGSLAFSKYAYFGAEHEYIMQDNNYLFGHSANASAMYKRYGLLCYFGNMALGGYGIDEDTKTDLTNKYNAGENITYTGSLLGGEVVSGSLTGDNLIVLSLNGLGNLAIDPYNTPNIYGLVHGDGISVQKLYGNNNNESEILLGADINFKKIDDIANDEVGSINCLAKQFSKDGYASINLIKNELSDDEEFYNIIGFNNTYFSQTENANEYEFLNNNLTKIIPLNSKFFTYYSTLNISKNLFKSLVNEEVYNIFENNYQNYINYVNSNNLGYLCPQKETDEFKFLKEYKSRAIIVDRAVGAIIVYLKTHTNTNSISLWNNTSLVIAGDYLQGDAQKLSGFSFKNFDRESYAIPFAIYNKDLANQSLNVFATTKDIYCTICDLYGIEHNEFLTIGTSIFANDNKLYYNRSVAFNDDFYSLTFDKYYAKDNTIETNAKLTVFETNLDKHLKKQLDIENFYYSKFYKEL